MSQMSLEEAKLKQSLMRLDNELSTIRSPPKPQSETAGNQGTVAHTPITVPPADRTRPVARRTELGSTPAPASVRSTASKDQSIPSRRIRTRGRTAATGAGGSYLNPVHGGGAMESSRARSRPRNDRARSRSRSRSRSQPRGQTTVSPLQQPPTHMQTNQHQQSQQPTSRYPVAKPQAGPIAHMPLPPSRFLQTASAQPSAAPAPSQPPSTGFVPAAQPSGFSTGAPGAALPNTARYGFVPAPAATQDLHTASIRTGGGSQYR